MLITKNSDRLNNSLINKYNDEYHNLKVIRDNSFHDRLIAIDSKEIYLLGSSVNSLGNKTTLIIKLEDQETINVLLNRINIVINKM